MDLYEKTACYFEENSRILSISMGSLRQMKGAHADLIASEVLGYLEHRGIDNPAARYCDRVEYLLKIQGRFEQTGRYEGSRYEDVPSLNREEYNIGLLMSYIVTTHRFEILESLQFFLGMACKGPRRLLAVGFGTGYELRWMRELLPDWSLDAFDISPNAIAYAKDLLSYFGHSSEGLRSDLFPLENDDNLDEYEDSFGKVVLCEVLEHLEDPAHALRNVRHALHPKGHAYLTMAINIAQEDHIYLCSTLDDARRLVIASGLRIVHEWVLPVSIFPVNAESREKNFRKGNYVCIAER